MNYDSDSSPNVNRAFAVHAPLPCPTCDNLAIRDIDLFELNTYNLAMPKLQLPDESAIGNTFV